MSIMKNYNVCVDESQCAEPILARKQSTNAEQIPLETAVLLAKCRQS